MRLKTSVFSVFVVLIPKMIIAQDKVVVFENQTEFSFYTNKVDFAEARTLCEEKNATLARVGNIAEFQFLLIHFDQLANSNSDFWIGKLASIFIDYSALSMVSFKNMKRSL